MKIVNVEIMITSMNMQRLVIEKHKAGYDFIVQHLRVNEDSSTMIENEFIVVDYGEGKVCVSSNTTNQTGYMNINQIHPIIKKLLIQFLINPEKVK